MERLADITGSVNEDLLRGIEYLLEENGVLRKQIQKRILLTDHEHRTLAERAVARGKLMADTVTIVSPQTILKWHRRLEAKILHDGDLDALGTDDLTMCCFFCNPDCSQPPPAIYVSSSEASFIKAAMGSRRGQTCSAAE